MENKIRFVELWFLSLSGSLHAMTIPTLGDKEPQTINELLNNKCLEKGSNIDGSSIGVTKVENSDLALSIDPKTCTAIELPSFKTMNHMKNEIPNRRVAVFANISDKLTSKVSDFDSRYMLKKVKEEYLDKENLVMRIKVEPEFFIVDPKTKKPIDPAGYATVYPVNKGQSFLLDLSNELKNAGIPIKVLHHENAPAQVEIELNFTEASKACDNVIIFKQLARTLAIMHGQEVTFMPKPMTDECGSGFHIHFRLYKVDPKTGKETNLFGVYDDPEKKSFVSETCQKYITGILNHMPAITAVANGSINSFKRLVPGFEAPTCIAWGYRNRSALIRIPSFSDPNDAAMEVRSPDASANIHMLLSLLIAAGMDGINSNVTPVPPVSKNLYDLESGNKEFKFLPKNLEEAVSEFEKDEFMKKVLGEKVVYGYSKIKKEEFEYYLHGFVSKWEFEKYFNC